MLPLNWLPTTSLIQPSPTLSDAPAHRSTRVETDKQHQKLDQQHLQIQDLPKFDMNSKLSSGGQQVTSAERRALFKSARNYAGLVDPDGALLPQVVDGASASSWLVTVTSSGADDG